MESESVIHSGFKLKSLVIKGHPVLGNNTFNFLDENDISESIYFSVLIGPNGTGKSQLFRCLMELFRGIYQFHNKGFRPPFFFRLEFYNNNTLHRFGNLSDNLYLKIVNFGKLPNGYPLAHLLMWDKLKNTYSPVDVNAFEALLPSNIIAISLMLTDRFIVPRNDKEKESFPIYKYLGVRNRPQQASTRGYVRRTVAFIVEQINSDVFKEGIGNLSKFLGYDGGILVQYKTAYTPKFFKGVTTSSLLDSFFMEIDQQYKISGKQPPFKLNHYKSIKKQSGQIEKIVDFMNYLFTNKRLSKAVKGSSSRYIQYRIDDDKDHSFLKEEYVLMDELRKLGFVSTPDIKLIKAEQELGVQETSSGEFHFFSTMVGLMATVKTNSLIFIDEPEISLHPNWQMRYLEFIRQLFSEKKYSTCHIIIATHSHFLISDLQGDSAKIIGLKKEGNQIQTMDINTNTYGWSAEDVLYNIFEVSSTRNFYVAEEIGNLLKEISKKDMDKEQISNEVEKLSYMKTTLKDNDPLKSLIKNIEKEFTND
ncbi:AAA family ATPase [Tenacibaculum sp. nBUS_03]|uniref:AAA family ATPase n=1 Tax=Tenacibaculum sp. nBUS_03 TaxID=3395320 RepID=UPI003EBE2BE7